MVIYFLLRINKVIPLFLKVIYLKITGGVLARSLATTTLLTIII